MLYQLSYLGPHAANSSARADRGLIGAGEGACPERRGARLSARGHKSAALGPTYRTRRIPFMTSWPMRLVRPAFFPPPAPRPSSCSRLSHAPRTCRTRRRTIRRWRRTRARPSGIPGRGSMSGPASRPGAARGSRAGSAARAISATTTPSTTASSSGSGRRAATRPSCGRRPTASRNSPGRPSPAARRPSATAWARSRPM